MWFCLSRGNDSDCLSSFRMDDEKNPVRPSEGNVSFLVLAMFLVNALQAMFVEKNPGREQKINVMKAFVDSVLVLVPFKVYPIDADLRIHIPEYLSDGVSRFVFFIIDRFSHVVNAQTKEALNKSLGRATT